MVRWHIVNSIENAIKGILFSLGGAVIGVIIWLIAIWLIRKNKKAT